MERLTYKNLGYVLRKPTAFAEGDKYPLVIYLHGAGGRGRDMEIIYTHPFFKETVEFLKDAVCVAPQCYADSWFNIFEQLQDFVEYAISWEYVDPTRVYVVGASMGGYATWQLAMSRPELFAGIVPICGGGMYWNTGRLTKMGVWAFHGDSDGCVFCEESKKMVDGVRACGGEAHLTIYKDGAHDAWTATFQNAEVWKWLLSHTLQYEVMKSKYDNVEQFG